MKYTLTFHPLLDSDVQEIISYYNSKQQGLGEAFFEELQGKYRSLKINPLFQKRYEDIRCLPLKRFPYMVHYSVDENTKTVHIEAVYGTAQDSKTNWKKRFFPY